MASPASVIREYLIDLAVIVRQYDPNTPPGSDEWCSVVSKLPPGADYPDQYVAIMDMGARSFQTNMRDNDTSQHPNVLFNVRAADYDVALNKGKEIEAALQAIGVAVGQSGNGMIQVSTEDGQDWVVRSIGLATPTTYAGSEETNDRQIFSINVRLDCERVTPANYRSIYPSSNPITGDFVIGIHGGITVLFPFTAFNSGGGGGGSFADQPPHYVFAGPVSGANAQPGFRLLTLDDLPDRYDHS